MGKREFTVETIYTTKLSSRQAAIVKGVAAGGHVGGIASSRRPDYFRALWMTCWLEPKVFHARSVNNNTTTNTANAIIIGGTCWAALGCLRLTLGRYLPYHSRQGP